MVGYFFQKIQILMEKRALKNGCFFHPFCDVYCVKFCMEPAITVNSHLYHPLTFISICWHECYYYNSATTVVLTTYPHIISMYLPCISQHIPFTYLLGVCGTGVVSVGCQSDVLYFFIHYVPISLISCKQ